MNELQVFNFEGKEIRTVIIDKEPWWIAKDICEVLGYNRVNDAVKYLDEDEKLLRQFIVAGQNRETYIINESGLYSLILRSRKSEAKVFKKVVTSEILPSIRKHGMYATESKLEEMLSDPNTMIKTLEALRDAREAKEIAIKERDEAVRTKGMIGSKREAQAMATASVATRKLNKVVEDTKFAIEFHNDFNRAGSGISIGEFAKMLASSGIAKMGQNKLFSWLRTNNMLTKSNQPYQKYVENGFFEVIPTKFFKPAPGTQRKDHIGEDVQGTKVIVTGKGMEAIYKKLKSEQDGFGLTG